MVNELLTNYQMVIHNVKKGNYRPLFVYFRPFFITIQIQIVKALMLCLGIEPGAAGW